MLHSADGGSCNVPLACACTSRAPITVPAASSDVFVGMSYNWIHAHQQCASVPACVLLDGLPIAMQKDESLGATHFLIHLIQWPSSTAWLQLLRQVGTEQLMGESGGAAAAEWLCLWSIETRLWGEWCSFSLYRRWESQTLGMCLLPCIHISASFPVCLFLRMVWDLGAGREWARSIHEFRVALGT